LGDVAAIASGTFHNLALASNGTVTAWGNNYSGQTNVPAGLSNIIAIAAAGSHSLALRNDGTVVGWGGNMYSQTNFPVSLDRVALIAAGENRNLVLPVGVNIDAITKDGPNAVIHFHTFAGYQYDLESCTNLSFLIWTPVLEPTLDGTGGVKTVTNANALVEADVRFYRLRESR
jgi:hypothetical protein